MLWRHLLLTRELDDDDDDVVDVVDECDADVNMIDWIHLLYPLPLTHNNFACMPNNRD